MTNAKPWVWLGVVPWAVFAFAVSLPALGEPWDFLVGTSTSAAEFAEVVAEYELNKRFPPTQFQIWRNVEYGPRGKQDASGELDVVVLERNSGRVVLVAEIKVTLRPDGGVGKATEQRTRFFTARDQGRLGWLRMKGNPKVTLAPEQFSGLREFVLAAPAGNVGEWSLPMSYDELQKTFLRVKAEGPCPARFRALSSRP